MIDRAIYETIKEQISLKPVVLITGARQVGKTTVCGMLSKESGIPYVTLADAEKRRMASTDPEMFIKVHGYPLIIDEIQYAPQLFEAIESVVDRERFTDPDAHGLFILTGSQRYRLMEGISQTMSGRVGMVDMQTVSLSEEYGLSERPFTVSPESAFARKKEIANGTDIFSKIIRGMYPEIISKRGLTNGIDEVIF